MLWRADLFKVRRAQGRRDCFGPRDDLKPSWGPAGSNPSALVLVILAAVGLVIGWST
jgi:hypothetical protein